MLDEIKTFDIKEGKNLTTQEAIDGAIDFLRFLIIFSIGECLYLHNPKSEFNQSLPIWIIKMKGVGFSMDKLNKMVMQILHSKEKFHQNISLQALLESGKDIIGGDVRNGILKNEAEQVREQKIKSLSNIQQEYYDLFEQGFSNQEVAKKLNNSPSTVSEMRNTLTDLFKDIKDSQILPDDEKREINLSGKELK